MNGLSTTKMSSKGQIVIPEDIRTLMRLVTGDRFVIMAEKDILILKLIKKPSGKEYEAILKNARLQAKKAGMKQESVMEAIKIGRKRVKLARE